MVTSTRVIGAAIGMGLPLAVAIALYWVGGGAPSGLVGLVFTVALLGIPIGPVMSAAYAPLAMSTDRPILTAGAAAHWAVFLGLIAYGVPTLLDLVAGRPAGGPWHGAIDPLQAALGYVVLFVPLLIVLWAFSMPFALLGVVMLRRLGPSGIARGRLVSLSLLLLVGAAMTGLDALGRHALV